MEAEPPLYPVAGAAGPQGDEDGCCVPDGPEAPVSGDGGRAGRGDAGLPGAGAGPGRPSRLRALCVPRSWTSWWARTPTTTRRRRSAATTAASASGCSGTCWRPARAARSPTASTWVRAARRPGALPPGPPRPLPGPSRKEKLRGPRPAFLFHFPAGRPRSRSCALRPQAPSPGGIRPRRVPRPHHRFPGGAGRGWAPWVGPPALGSGALEPRDRPSDGGRGEGFRSQVAGAPAGRRDSRLILASLSALTGVGIGDPSGTGANSSVAFPPVLDCPQSQAAPSRLLPVPRPPADAADPAL